jgi:putative transposase
MNMNPELVNNQHSVGQNCFHLTWTPKYRYPLARSDGMKKVIAIAITRAAERHAIKIIELRVLDDHVHCFVHLPPTISVSNCVQLLKGGSAHHVRAYQKWRRKYKALWSRGYFYRSVGAVTGAVVENYIKNSQGKHAYWNQTTIVAG